MLRPNNAPDEAEQRMRRVIPNEREVGAHTICSMADADNI